MLGTDSRDYGSLFRRKHPFYAKNQRIWQKCIDAYAGGEEYIKTALIRHLSETVEEFSERTRRAYYFNFPRKIARIITHYVLSTRPDRENADPVFCEDWSRTGLRVDEVMRQFSTAMNVFGTAWLAVDMPAFVGKKTKADEVKERLRPYCVAVSPLFIHDWCYGNDGELDWVFVAEQEYNNSDPFSEPKEIQKRKLWTRETLTTVLQAQDGTRKVDFYEHNLGKVPFIRQVETDGYGLCANHWFEDAVRISDAIMNNESEAQMNVIKQMFGLLVVSETFANNAGRRPVASVEGEEDTNTDNASLSSTIARTVAIIENSEDKGISRYISPAGVENATIRTENADLRKMLFEVIGLANPKETRAAESAEAKMWDFQNIEQYMRSRADMLEQTEQKAWEIMKLWQPAISIPDVSYNRNFAMLDLKDAVATLLELSSFNVDSDGFQKEVGKTAVSLLNRLRQLTQDKQEAIENEIEKVTAGKGMLTTESMSVEVE